MWEEKSSIVTKTGTLQNVLCQVSPGVFPSVGQDVGTHPTERVPLGSLETWLIRDTFPFLGKVRGR